MKIKISDVSAENEYWQGTYTCSNCNSNQIFKGFKYCPDCGEAIEWDDGYEYNSYFKWQIKQHMYGITEFVFIPLKKDLYRIKCENHMEYLILDNIDNVLTSINMPMLSSINVIRTELQEFGEFKFYFIPFNLINRGSHGN